MEHKPPSPRLVFSLIAFIILIWALNYVASKLALREFDALTLSSFRIVLAAAAMTVIFLMSPRTRSFDRTDVVKFTQLGVFGVIMNQMFFTIGLSLTSVSHSALIVGLGPIYVMLLAWLMGLELLSPSKVLGMMVAFAGVVLLGSEHGFNLRSGTLLGDLTTMGGSLAFSMYVVLGKKVARKYSSIEMNFFNYLVAAVLILPIAVRQGLVLDWNAISWRGWTALLYAALCASVLAYLLYFWALRHVTASRIAAFSYLLPVMATLAGIFLLGERPTLFLYAGGALVLCGVWLAERAPDRDTCADEDQQTV